MKSDSLDLDAARPNRLMCLSCKGGRMLCGLKSCPLLKRLNIENPHKTQLKKEVFGPSSTVFVGRAGYPNVQSGPLTGLRDDIAGMDDPGSWYGMGFDDIIYMRSLLVRGRQKRPVMDRSRYTEKMQEIALSVRSVDIEAHYTKPPKFEMDFSPITQPMGAQGQLKNIIIAQNPVIPRRVDYVISDDLTSTQQIDSLYEKNFDVYYLSNVLSSGSLGKTEKKKMVPTRWSITAVDDMLSKNLISDIADHPMIQDVQVYHNTYLENHFEILLIPGAWEFELFEAWSSKSIWAQGDAKYSLVVENETNRGRTGYAYNEGGGYYAGRFAVSEALSKMRKQARAIVFREIYEGYVVPVGVWEVRENIRAAMKKSPLKFKSVNDALRDIGGRLDLPLGEYLKKSEILSQRRLSDYT